MDGNATTIEQVVLRWPGATSEPGGFDAVAFRYGKREIGHLHRDRVVAPPSPPTSAKNSSLKAVRPSASAGVKGYISYPIRNPEDVFAVVEIIGRNYDRAKAAAERCAASQQKMEEKVHRRRASASAKRKKGREDGRLRTSTGIRS